MTELERIEIEGFKGIESLAFEPSGINLITGRNNTGKTSLLESIDILLNPENIEGFDEETGSLVNASKDKAGIRGKTVESRPDVEIRQLSDDEAESLFTDSISYNLKYQLTLSGSNRKGQRHLREVQDIVRGIIKDHISTDIIYDIKRGSVIVVINGKEYPYLSVGPKVSRRASTISADIQKEVSKRTDCIEFVEEPDAGRFKQGEERQGTSQTEDQVYGRVISSIRSWFGHRTKSKFLWKPTEEGGVEFIRGMELTEGFDSRKASNVAVKIDDIGDYVKGHGLVSGLKTFGRDHLVFEDDDEGKYQIPFSFMGDGFKAVVGLLWELLDDDISEQIILLEEPESHMHPGYIREVVYFLIKLAQEEDVQLFITTHNSDFINGFFNENLTDDQREYLKEEFSLIRMEKDAAQVLDYETAESDLKDLHLDLRGI